MSMLHSISKTLRLFRRDSQGIAALEFALCLPTLMLLLLGSIELSRFLLIAVKTEKAAYTMADLVAQTQAISLTDTEITQLMNSAQEIMRPFTFGTSGRMIVTSVTKTGSAAPTIRWQRSGGGTLTATSHIGTTVGATASLPTGFTMASTDNIIIAEVFYQYTTMFGTEIANGTTLYRSAYFKPRLGALTTPPT